MHTFRPKHTPLPHRIMKHANRKTSKFVSVYVFMAFMAFMFFIFAALMQARETIFTLTRLQDEGYVMAKVTPPPRYKEGSEEGVVANLAKIVKLPPDENPNVATIDDINKLKDQPFFSNAKTGDKLVLFEKAKVAYLFSPDGNILLNLGPYSPPKKESKVLGEADQKVATPSAEVKK